MNIITKLLLIFLGTLSLILGCIGLIMPILPTTPFILVTAFCYTKSSKKLDNYFKSTKFYKKHLEELVVNKTMTKTNKLKTLSLITIVLAIPFFLTQKFSIKMILMTILILHYFFFLFKVKTNKNV